MPSLDSSKFFRRGDSLFCAIILRPRQLRQRSRRHSPIASHRDCNGSLGMIFERKACALQIGQG